MKRKRKHPEIPIKSKFSIARLCPFIPGEDPRARHRRRHYLALANVETVRTWCEYRGIQFSIAKSNHPDVSTPEGWKWDFRLPNKFAQWRPFAGKLSMKMHLTEGALHSIKVYDTEQLLIVLEEWANSRENHEKD